MPMHANHRFSLHFITEETAHLDTQYKSETFEFTHLTD